MTTLLTHDTADAQVEDATPGCGCCVPPPDAGSKGEVAALRARRERLERRLRDLLAATRSAPA